MASSVSAELLKQLSSASDSLNSVSNQFNEQVNSIENSIAAYNLGVSAWVHVRTIDHEELDQAGNVVDIHAQDISVGYDKWAGKWCLQVHSFYADSESLQEWTLKDAPREMRLNAIDGIPKLLEKLIAEATRLTQQIADKTAEARKLAQSIQPRKGQ
jgi:hypothetical protein